MGKAKSKTSNYAGLTFTSEQDGSTVSWKADSSLSAVNLQYSTDGSTWTEWAQDDSITINNGESLYIKGNNKYIAYNISVFTYFVMTGLIAASGDIVGLFDDGACTTVKPFDIFSLFKNCTALTTPPDLTSAAGGIFAGMFYGCTALTTAPELPAITLCSSCYYQMFYGCTSLTKAPELPATTLVNYCYYQMFYGCTSLTQINAHFYTWPTAKNALNDWVNGVPSSGTFNCPQALTDVRGTSNIPEGWNKVSITPSRGAFVMFSDAIKQSDGTYRMYTCGTQNVYNNIAINEWETSASDELPPFTGYQSNTMIVLDCYADSSSDTDYDYIRLASQREYFTQNGSTISADDGYKYAIGIFSDKVQEEAEIDTDEKTQRSTWKLIDAGNRTFENKGYKGYYLENEYLEGYYLAWDTDNSILKYVTSASEASEFFFMETEFGMQAGTSTYNLAPSSVTGTLVSSPSGKSFDIYSALNFVASFSAGGIIDKVEKFAYRIKCEGLLHNTSTWMELSYGGRWSNLVSDWDGSATEKPDDCWKNNGWGVPGVTSASLDIFNWRTPDTSLRVLNMTYPAQGQDDVFDARRYTLEILTSRTKAISDETAAYFTDYVVDANGRGYRGISYAARSNTVVVKPSWFVDTATATITTNGLYITFNTTLKRSLETNNYTISDIYGYNESTGSLGEFLHSTESLTNAGMDTFDLHIPFDELAYFPNDGDYIVLEVYGTSNSSYVQSTMQDSRLIIQVSGQGGELTPKIDYEYLNDYDIKYTVGEESGITPTKVITKLVYLHDGKANFKDVVLYNGEYYLGAPLNTNYDIYTYIEYVSGGVTKWGALHTIMTPKETLAIVLNAEDDEFVFDKFLSNAPLSLSGDVDNESMSLQGNRYPDVFKGTSKTVKIQIDKAVVAKDDIEYLQSAINGGDCLLRDNMGLYTYVVVTSYNINKISNDWYSVDLTMQETSRSFDYYLPWSIGSNSRANSQANDLLGRVDEERKKLQNQGSK